MSGREDPPPAVVVRCGRCGRDLVGTAGDMVARIQRHMEQRHPRTAYRARARKSGRRRRK